MSYILRHGLLSTPIDHFLERMAVGSRELFLGTVRASLALSGVRYSICLARSLSAKYEKAEYRACILKSLLKIQISAPE